MTVSSSRESSPLEQQEDEEVCPLLQGAPVTCLPPRYRSLLMDDGNNNNGSWEGNNNVVFYPGHMPPRPGMYMCCAFSPFLTLVFFFALVFNNVTLRAYDIFVSALSVYCLFYFSISAYRSHKKRSLLYTKDNNGNHKIWPGDWKAGMYLVGGLALLNFDGKRVWLFPMESIVDLKQVSCPAQIILKIRSPHPEEETLQEYVLNLNRFVLPTKGKDIQRWYRHFTRNRTIIRGDGERGTVATS